MFDCSSDKAVSGTAKTTSQAPATYNKQKVCLIGSGNWGSAIAKIVGRTVLDDPAKFDPIVKMWVFEEMLDGRKLTDIINQDHENVKYLPGIKLPENIVAVPDLVEAAKDATLLVLVIPHQFVKRTCDTLRGKIPPGAKAVSLIKGVDIDAGGLVLISDIIRDGLGIDCSVLMGANIANEVAAEQFAEATLGYRDLAAAKLFQQVFNTKYFRVNTIEDVAGVELCGALKNVVAIGAGLSDGLKYGDNTKAALIRIGLAEMRKFAKVFYEGVKDETFFESCGVADLITTCNGGRNRKVAEARVLTGKPFDVLEKEMLNGQKLQGTSTAGEVHEILAKKNLVDEFPLFHVIYQIVYKNVPPEKIVDW